MRPIRFSLIIIFFTSLSLEAQDFEKMNKSELRGLLINLISRQDSLQTIILSLESSKNMLVEKLSSFEQKNKANEFEISKLTALIEKNRIETERFSAERQKLISEAEYVKIKYEEVVQQLSSVITSLRDTISSYRSLNTINTSVSESTIKSDSTAATEIAQVNRNDFLNKYFFDQFPLTNHNFELVLTKVIYGDVSKSTSRRYDNGYMGGVDRIPEILNVSAFTFWGIQPKQEINYEGNNVSSYTFARASDYLDSRLPKIEVLKNKLFTFKYPSGEEESFLFNIKQTGTSYNNNRKVLQIELANEDVKSDGTNNTAKDIVWRIYAIENECYLALEINQLSRLNLNLKYVGRRSDGKNSLYNTVTTGDEIILSRNEDNFMSGARYIDPDELIYLFKLK